MKGPIIKEIKYKSCCECDSLKIITDRKGYEPIYYYYCFETNGLNRIGMDDKTPEWCPLIKT